MKLADEFELRNNREVTLNVRPIEIGLYHDYVFEGPCRFGRGDELTREHDMMVIEMKSKNDEKMLHDLFDGIPGVNVMDQIVIKRDETFPLNDAMLEKMATDRDDVDLYVFNFTVFGADLAIAFSQKYGKPSMILPTPNNDAHMSAAYRARGLEMHSPATLEEAKKTLVALRARKVMANTRALVVVRNNSVHPVTNYDSFLDHFEVTKKLGTSFTYYNLHEFLDQLHNVAPDTNPTLPGRVADNINDEDEKAVGAMVDEFMTGATVCDMDRDKIVPSMRAHYLVNKLLKKLDCNAFAAPCPDMCATRRLNHEQTTLCLNHTLNNENGVCSACEQDVSALLSMVALSAVSQSAPYMGNTVPVKLDADDELRIKTRIMFRPYSCDEETPRLEEQHADAIMSIYHAVPNRQFKGYDAEQAPYDVRPFAMDGRWGATVRYDFKRDIGEPITLAKFDPTCSKLLVARGTIVGGIGALDENCSEGVFFSVSDGRAFREATMWTGNHTALVYGDWFDEMVLFAESVGLEPLAVG
ncbi:hypothetical protein [Gordonibacter massiliensis (ex Traore et al. 2017)]|uniref:hypothetical protein n=1 Tax=Gordonibacter massiliensis (ex Traore et al. 2017) TaxID=1841863 RepID=UPI001C8CB1F5|nr:hypothetical protein [Gordonibacter massiliensis (ex Traore et al. 2017)]MBX9034942.1 hypothetical protein [Gordonibacter massiliensis (ex Traore et al. 2017)]